MTDRLSLYNEALRQCGQRKLATLSDETPARHYLDDVWDGGGVDHCLQQGLWNFAIRTVRFDFEPAIAPEFGYAHAFTKPADFLRLVQIGGNGDFSPPLNAYEDERGFWWADVDQLFVRYVSNDALYGQDMSLWTPAFAKFAALHFAFEIAPRLTSSGSDLERLERRLRRARTEARSYDAQEEPTRFAPAGNWTRARRGGASGRRQG
ncbi:MAG: hypothetical protein AB7R90_04125 [Reyranellaceae bacterium]